MPLVAQRQRALFVEKLEERYVLSGGFSAICPQDTATCDAEYSHIQELWASSIQPYLADDLWSDRDAYDAGHTLMVPLHAAFVFQNESWQATFSDHYQRFLTEDSGFFEKRGLAQLQYLYTASRFLALATQSGNMSIVPDGLPSQLHTSLASIWQSDASIWGLNFPNGSSQRLRWKLDATQSERSYHVGVTDVELLAISIAADLRIHERLARENSPSSELISELLAFGREVFEREVVHQPNGGWLLQPGAWTDHPDFAFAGHLTEGANLSTAPAPGISEDSSHFHRMPVFLTSLRDANPIATADYQFFDELKSGLEQQFFSSVIVAPDENSAVYRLSNYMDGSNGLYRWLDEPDSATGFGPFELSTTLLAGWWSFLDTPRIRDVYAHVDDQLDDYLQFASTTPQTSRPRNPLATDNATLELIAAMSSYLRMNLAPPTLIQATASNGLAPLVTLHFSEPIRGDQSAISVLRENGDPIAPGSVHGFGGTQLQIQLPTLKASERYRIVIADGEITDRVNISLDGDLDGLPGGQQARELIVVPSTNQVIGVSANGGTSMTFRYEIVQDAIQPFNLAFFESTDAHYDESDVSLAAVHIARADELTAGLHEKALTIGADLVLPGAGLPAPTKGSYIIAVAEPELALDAAGQFVDQYLSVLTGSYHIAAGSVVVHGANTADVISFDLATGTVDLNDQSFKHDIGDIESVFVFSHQGDDILNFTGVVSAGEGPMPVVYHGGPGANTANVTGGSDQDLIHVNPMTATMRSPGYAFVVNSVEMITLDGGDGADEASFDDSPAFDQFYVSPGMARFRSREFDHRVLGARTIDARSTQEQVDCAYFYGLSGDDTFVANPAQAVMTSEGYSATAVGFSRVFATAKPGGADDRAEFTDAASADSLVATPAHATLAGSEYANRAVGFETVSVISRFDGDGDTARLYDSSADDMFQVSPVAGSISGPGYEILEERFEFVVALALSGGDDQAHFRDSPRNEVLTATPSYANLVSTEFHGEADYFEQVFAVSIDGGSDVANLFDSYGNDSLVATPADTTLTGPGFRHSVSGFDRVNAYATSGGEDDQAVLYDSPGDDSFSAYTTHAEISGDGFVRYAQGFDSVVARAAAGGDDVATLHDSPHSDVLSATPAYVNLSGPAFYIEADYFEETTAHGTNGSGDVAHLIDSPGNDVFVARPSSVELSGPNFRQYLTDFDSVLAASHAGGSDLAYFQDSPADELFNATPVYATLSGVGFFREADHFDRVVVSSEKGGRDVANLFDSAGNDRLIASLVDATLSGDGFQYLAQGFARVNAYAIGGKDDATLFDSIGDDSFRSYPDSAELVGSGSELYARGFDSVIARASSGGEDQAWLHGSPSGSLLNATPTYVNLTGNGFYSEVDYFEKVIAYSQSQARDVANLYGSPRDDHLVATPDYAALTGDGFDLTAFGYSRVNAYAFGGQDEAWLYDSNTSDLYRAYPSYAEMFGNGFQNYARGFSHVQAYSSAGGYDRAWFFDSPYDEKLIASARHIALSGNDFNNTGDLFAEAVAYSTLGGSDLARIGEIDLVLELVGDWLAE